MTTDKHADRGHAPWSASASARNWACPGAYNATKNLPPQPESFAAAWGTACHQLSERCLQSGKDADEYIGLVEQTSEHEIEVDEELAQTAQVYIDYVRQLGERADWLRIEQYYSLASLKPPIEAGGTADATAWLPEEGVLEVVDLKGGRGVFVSAVENKQARTYALGALLAHPGLPVEKVRATIVQPRIQNSAGFIRSEEFETADLIDWTTDLLAAMEASAKPDAPFVAGDHCSKTFCPAQGFCPALKAKALDAAGVWFDDLGDAKTSNQPDDMMPEQIAQVLDSADMIQDWLNAVRAYAHRQVELGVAIPNYMLVDKRATKKWKADVDVAKAVEGMVDADLIYNDPKIKTPTQIIKLLGKKADAIADLWEAKSSGTNLVRKDKTTRKEVQPAVQQHFDILD